MGWNFLSFGLGKLLSFVTLAILARYLTPSDYGIVAFAALAISALTLLKDLGLGAALIQRRQDVHEAADTVFTINVIIDSLLSLAAFLVAPTVALYFNEPVVQPVLRWLGLSFGINALGSVHTIRLQRELDFRRKTVPDLGRAVVRGAVSIGLAVSGAGVWALVFGQLAGATSSVLLAWIVFPWRPRLSINKSIAHKLLRFGVSMIGIDALSIVIDNLGYFLVGRLMGKASLGIYTLAYRLPELMLINVLWVIGQVTFPVFASIQDQPDHLRSGFLTTVRIVELIAVPICLGLLIAADPLIRVAFGEQWIRAIPILRVLAIYAWVLSIGFHVGGIYKAIGRPDISVKLSLFTLAVLIPSVLIGVRYGMLGIAWGYVIAALLRAVARLIVVTRFVEVTIVDVLAQFKPALRGGAALTLLALLAVYLTTDTPPIVQLLTISTLGAFGYIGVVWAWERETIMQTIHMIGARRAKEEL